MCLLVQERDVEVKKAISQEDIRRTDMTKGRQGDSGYPGYYPMRESSYRGGQPYGGSGGRSGGGGGGYDSYHRMSGELIEFTPTCTCVMWWALIRMKYPLP